MTQPRPANAVIAEALSKYNVIIHQHLSYLSDIPVGESRRALEEYIGTKPQNVYPIYIVSGSRFVHSQLSYVYLITHPAQLESTKSKFQTVVAVQYYGLVKSTTEPTAVELQDFLNTAQDLLQQYEIQQMTQVPLLDPNPFRTNAYSPIRNNSIERKSNAFSNTVKPVVIQEVKKSAFDTGDDFGISASRPAPKPAVKSNGTIQQKQNRLQFGSTTSTSGQTNAASGAFDEFDDDIISSSTSSFRAKKPPTTSSTTTKSTPSINSSSGIKRQSSTITANLFDELSTDTQYTLPVSAKPTPTKHTTPTPTNTIPTQPRNDTPASLFDEFDDDDYSMTTTSSSTAKNKKKSTTPSSSNKTTTTSAATAAPSTKPGKRADVIVESDDSDYDPMEGLNTYGDERETTGKGSVMGNDDDSDDDMVKMAKGKNISNKKNNTNTPTPTAPSGIKKVIIDDESDDGDEYVKSVKTSGGSGDKDNDGSQQSGRSLGWKKLTDAELKTFQQEEATAKVANKKAQQAKTVEQNKQYLTGGGMGTGGNDHKVRTNPETGKQQRLVKVSKTITRVDEEGFDVTEKIFVDEWQDEITPKPSAPKPSAPLPSQSNQPPQQWLLRLLYKRKSHQKAAVSCLSSVVQRSKQVLLFLLSCDRISSGHTNSPL